MKKIISGQNGATKLYNQFLGAASDENAKSIEQLSLSGVNLEAADKLSETPLITAAPQVRPQ
jgi:hypothetical protein